MRRAATVLLLTGAALVTTGATPKEAAPAQFDRAPKAMAYAGSGLSFFAIVWAGFVLMAERAQERGGGSAKTAVVIAVVGLVEALSAKGPATLLRHGLLPIVPTPGPKGIRTSIAPL